MGWRRPLLLSAFALAGCAAPQGAGGSPGRNAALAAQPWEIDPYTHTQQIIVDGGPVGYLVTYDATPDGLVIERHFPTGAKRILDERFEDVGFISPRGLFFRHGKKGAEELGYHELIDGLAGFFAGKSQTRLVEFGGEAPKRAAAAAAAGEGDGETSGGDAVEGSEAAEGG